MGCSVQFTPRAWTDRALQRCGLGPKPRRIVLHYLSLLAEQLAAMLPLSLLQVLVLAIFFNKTGASPLLEAAGLISAVLGLVLFLDGLRVAIMPMAMQVGRHLPQWLPMFWVLLVAFALGVLVTYAEPAIAAIRPLAALVNPESAPYLYYVLNQQQEVTVLSIGLGVGLAAVLGMLKFLYDISLKLLIAVSLIPTIGLACYMQWGNPHLRPILGVAWDCGAVTTGPVTVPILLALGVSVMKAQRQKQMTLEVLQQAALDRSIGNTLEGFGIVTLASLLPILAVEFMSIMFSLVHPYEEVLRLASEAAHRAQSNTLPIAESSPVKEVLFALRAIAPLCAALLLLVLVVLRVPLPDTCFDVEEEEEQQQHSSQAESQSDSADSSRRGQSQDDGRLTPDDHSTTTTTTNTNMSRKDTSAPSHAGNATAVAAADDIVIKEGRLWQADGSTVVQEKNSRTSQCLSNSCPQAPKDAQDIETGKAPATAAAAAGKVDAPTAVGKGSRARARAHPAGWSGNAAPVAAAVIAAAGERTWDYTDQALPYVARGPADATGAAAIRPSGPASLTLDAAPGGASSVPNQLSGASSDEQTNLGAVGGSSSSRSRWCACRAWLSKHGSLLGGLVMCQVGMIMFNLGLTYGFTALGDLTGTWLPTSFMQLPYAPGSPYYSLAGGVTLTMVTVFLLGVLATNAEPALQVLGQTVQTLSNGKFSKRMLIWAVSIGVAVGMDVGACKILFSLPLIYFILAKYAAASALTVLTKEAYTAVAWDSAGVTTGPVTVPFVLAIGLAFGKAVGAPEGFGMLTVMSVAPIISVLLTSLLRKPVQRAATEIARVSRDLAKMSLERFSKRGDREVIEFTTPDMSSTVFPLSRSSGSLRNSSGGGLSRTSPILARVSPMSSSWSGQLPPLGRVSRSAAAGAPITLQPIIEHTGPTQPSPAAAAPSNQAGGKGT